MGWIRVSDDFYDNDKIDLVGPLGIAIYVVSMAYCNRNLTDGFFPKSKAKTFLDVDQVSMTTVRGELFAAGVEGLEAVKLLAETMVAAGLWHEEGHACESCRARADGGDPTYSEYLIHDYLQFQPSREQVLAERKRLQEYRERKKAERTATVQRTNGVRTASPTPTPTPTKEGAARAPRPHCSQHEENTDGEKCRACMKRREWDEAQEELQRADELDAKRRLREIANSCPVCKGTNWIPDTDPAVKCDHQAAVNG